MNQRRAPPAALVRARAMNSVKSDMPMSLPSSSYAHLPPEADLGHGSGRSPASLIPSPMNDRGNMGGYRNRLQNRGSVRFATGRRFQDYPPAGTPSDSTPRHSRSPSPVPRRPNSSRAEIIREAEHRATMIELKLNGFDHVHIEESQLSGGGAREEDVRDLFAGFPVDRVSEIDR